MTTALYAGSFDPITKGHVDLIERAASIFEEVYVVMAINESKKYLFSTEEKVAFAEDALAHLDNVKICSFSSGLTVSVAKELGAKVLIRGLRNTSDFENEAIVAFANKLQDADIQTMFFLADEKYRFVSSSIIKEIAINKGDVSSLVTPMVERALKEKYRD